MRQLSGAPAVCHVAYARYPGDPRVRKEAEALARTGYRVDVIGLRETEKPREETIAGVRVRRLPLEAIRGSRARYVYQYFLFFLLVALELARRQVRQRYRIVHIHSLPDFLVFAGIPSRFLGARLVLDLHESMPELYLARFPDRQGGFLHRMAILVQRASCFVASYVVTVNDRIGALLAGRGTARSRLVIVENAPQWDSSDIPITGNGGGKSESVVIVGGLNPERDLELVVRAASKVNQRIRVRWRFVGYGERSYIERLQSLANDSGLREVLTIEPEVPAGAVPALIGETSVGIVSYERNPITEIATPNKAYEYGIAGKAMVVADLGALRDLFGDSVLYYRPGDADDLARNVLRVLADPELRERLGRDASGVVTRHRWPIMEGRLVRIYDDLARGGKSDPEGFQARKPPTEIRGA